MKDGQLPQLDKEETIKLWAEEAAKILDDPEEIFDLAGKRLALVSSLLREHFSNPNHTFRIAIIGDPNLGKSTYAYSVTEILKRYDIPSTYYDLDIYTRSGLALSGQTKWENRPKRKMEEISAEEIAKNIQEFASLGPGIVIGDFPGMIDDPFQVKRLKKANLALIFAGAYEGLDKWFKLCGKASIGFRWVISNRNMSSSPPYYPQIGKLERKVVINSALITSATSILAEAAALTGVEKIPYQKFFSAPELIVLEEFLDFYFSIQLP